MTRCVRPHARRALAAGAADDSVHARESRGKQRGLARADAIIAVSSTIAADLRARSPELAATRSRSFRMRLTRRRSRRRLQRSAPPLAGPYALYLGKLAPNKGTTHLVQRRSNAPGSTGRWSSPVTARSATSIARDAARSTRDIRLVGWVDQRSATAWMAHASMLVFPSRGPESLSRVLIEASALGVPIAAMNTGGTPDIIENGETGLLSRTPEELADDMRRLRARSGSARRASARPRERTRGTRFDASVVIARIERLYRDLLARAR